MSYLFKDDFTLPPAKLSGGSLLAHKNYYSETYGYSGFLDPHAFRTEIVSCKL
jgi:hypothetical protein